MVSTEVIVTTYNNPTALHLALLGLEGQSTQDFRVCVADDGSGPATRELIERWRDRIGADRFRHVWHPDNGFAKNEILNKAIASSNADYLVFIDGDCIASPAYIQRHFDLRRPSQFVSGSLIRMPLDVNKLLTDDLITSRTIFQINWLKAHGCVTRLGTWLKTASLPLALANVLELISPVKKVWNGCNSAGWRADLLKVNGFDEAMKYGAEDVEMGVRLNNAGIQGRHNRYTAPLLHIEHARGYADPVVAAANKRYMKSVRRSGRAWTAQGIVKSDGPSFLTHGGSK
jgi:glycosyltransferase involved in cell wall biosynthesis